MNKISSLVLTLLGQMDFVTCMDCNCKIIIYMIFAVLLFHMVDYMNTGVLYFVLLPFQRFIITLCAV